MKIYFKSLVIWISVSCAHLLSAQNLTKDTSFFQHISYVGGPPTSSHHTLNWYTKEEVPETYFVVEHYCWNRWVKRDKVKSKGIQGKTDGKFQYSYKITRHSGDNKLRVLLMNDSNVCLAVSKELNSMQERVPKASFSNKKKDKKIEFSYETYYEVYNAKDSLVKKGCEQGFSYSDLESGEYSLYYDSSVGKLKVNSP